MPNSPIALGLLDFSWTMRGESAADALNDTQAMAVHAERCGFSRYWLGEHHVEGHACGSPQILAAIAATRTRRIRIGIGAMLLGYWAPLKLAEDFSLLETMFGRIDLGLGRGRADSLASHRALLDGRPGDDGMLSSVAFASRLDDLLGHLDGTLAAGHAHAGAPVLPNAGASPEVWICGSSGAALEAARTGTRFCCTLFHGRIEPPELVQTYRDRFVPSRDLATPHAAIALAGVCAETKAEAIAMRDCFPNPNYLPSLVGTPAQCRGALEAVCEAYEVRDLILLDVAPDRTRRLRSATLLAEEMGLAR